MRRSHLNRLVATLVAAWTLIIQVGPAALHACPTHDGAATAAPTAHHAAHHATAAAINGEQTHPDSAPSHSHRCTCLGPCCNAAPVAIITSDALLAFATVLPSVPREPGAPLLYVPSAPEHARPPSLGPPALHIA
jgi:hypothetical protein